MNFNCDTQKIGFCDTVCETTTEQSLDADISLPDYCPEIQRILKCTVIPNVTSVQNVNGRITADINAVVRLLYVGDNGKTAGYEQSYPIQKFVESSRLASDSAVSVKVNTDYVNSRAVNSRRVDIRAMMSFVFKALDKRNEELLCGADGAGIQIMKEEFNFASVSGVCEKSFSIGEVIELSSEKSSLTNIINVTSSAISTEIKIINNKALVKGSCTVKIYYIGEENYNVECVEHSMPISQIIEMEGLNEKCISSIRLRVCSCEAVPKTDSSGDVRLIDLNARLSAFALAFDEKPVSLIADAYSTKYEVKNTFRNIEFMKINEKFDTSFTNKVVLESIGVSVDCVLAVWCSDIKYSFSVRDNKCCVTGTYQTTVVYRDSEGQTGIIQKPVDFEYYVVLSQKTEKIVPYADVQISGCSCAVTGDSRLELKTEILLNGVVLSSYLKKYIYSIELSEENLKKSDNCSLTIYFCEKGESLWNIARKYNTTVDAIMFENEINSEIIEESRMMLIPSA